MTTEITTPVCRLVTGHPMVSHPVIDKITKQQKVNKDGSLAINFYIGVAIQKGQETDWKATEWGQKIYAEGVNSWPNGEYNSPQFAWKIDDGDSLIPNKVGKRPCDREGWPGHWVIHISNGFPFGVYNRGQYLAHQQIDRKEAIKAGDYVRVVFDVKSNNPSETPGLYLNPSLFELYQAGVEIVSANAPDANEKFGDVAATMPSNAQIDPNVQGGTAPQANGPTPPPQQQTAAPGPGNAAPPPEPAILQPKMYNLNGQTFSEAQLKQSGWKDEQIANLPVV